MACSYSGILDNEDTNDFVDDFELNLEPGPGAEASNARWKPCPPYACPEDALACGLVDDEEGENVVAECGVVEAVDDALADLTLVLGLHYGGAQTKQRRLALDEFPAPMLLTPLTPRVPDVWKVERRCCRGEVA